MQTLITKIAESYDPAFGYRKKADASTDFPKFRRRGSFCAPVLAPLLYNRRISCIFVVVGVVQLLLTIAGVRGWQCPIHASIGVICPGCGLTTALAMLLKGHWHVAVATHAFAPVGLIVLICMLTAIVLPTDWLNRFCGCVERLERKTGITAILLLGMVLYWLLKIFNIH